MNGRAAGSSGSGRLGRIVASAVILLMLQLMSACGSDATGGVAGVPESVVSHGATVEEVWFSSGGFELVGDVHFPAEVGPLPAVIVVHGDGPQTRASTPGTHIIRDKFGAAGFAVLSWDKPGSGESTGVFEQGQTLRQRAAILTDGVEYLAEHPRIDADRIGLWGLSQAGWVMPLALERTDGVAFMIVVSGGGEDSIEQLGYQLGQDVVCDGLPPEQGDLVAAYFPQAAKGPSYEMYLEAMEVLVEVEGWENFVGPEIRAEEDWQPWPTDIDAYFDPISVVESTTFPVLAVFGEMDRYIDPVQGAEAYETALRGADNPNYHVELIPQVGHTMQVQTTKCSAGGTTSERYLDLLDEWIETLQAHRGIND